MRRRSRVSPNTKMRVVALEEHFASRELAAEIPKEKIRERGWPEREMGGDQISDLGPKRIETMDEAGVTVQVLSVSGPGAELLDEAAGPKLAAAYNDRIADAICANPGRYGGFAHLPMTAPEAAADELERCVRELAFSGALINGTTVGLFLDDPRFEPILARAEALGVPIYVHPSLPPKAVADAYYRDLPEMTGFLLSIAGWGWHSETAIHILRLVLSGSLERHPNLKLIVGHMGEMFPIMMTRMDDVFCRPGLSRLTRTISETLTDQLWITTSGFFSIPPFLAALSAFGADRILFSVDYPFSPNKRATDFLRQLPVSHADLEKIAFRNADALLGLTNPGT
jgi:predicted TIM-barrel fold metal-dependent hydrolase